MESKSPSGMPVERSTPLTTLGRSVRLKIGSVFDVLMLSGVPDW
ncbi:MAG TPA: hypothetical protein VFQ79_08935 [Bryobacteraceae bacterium]|nr:hypothetical protein [Bryobacteraceae bacterium]